ncbi:MAG: hypothetical protein AAF907_00055 [Planctomycetota bacterium]
MPPDRLPDSSPQGGSADPPADAAAGDDPTSKEAKSIRAARLELIREQIAAGLYDDPDRLDAALDGLLADLTD